MKAKCGVWFCCALLATGCAVAAGVETSEALPQTELGKLAASLKPGEMKELKTKGYTRELLKSWYDWDHDAAEKRLYGAQKMFHICSTHYSNTAKWDPTNRQALVMGIGHYAAMKFIVYSDASNSWKLMPPPTWCDPRRIECRVEEVLPENRLKLSAGRAQGMWPEAQLIILREGKTMGRAVVKELGASNSVALVAHASAAILAGDVARNPDAPLCGKDGTSGRSWPRGHFYDRVAISPEHRLFAVNWHGLQLYHLDSNVWTRAAGSSASGKDAYQMAEYFPELNSFVYESNWGRDLRLWDVGKKAERKLGTYRGGMHGVMEYNPVHKVLVWGLGDGGEQGCRIVFRMNAQGKIETLKPAPIFTNCRDASKFICDPVSGEFLAQEMTSDAERKKSGLGRVFAFHPLRDEWKLVEGVRFPYGRGTAVNTYGVLMFFTGGQVFVYKHKPVFTDTDAAPLSVGPASPATAAPAGNTAAPATTAAPDKD